MDEKELTCKMMAFAFGLTEPTSNEKVVGTCSLCGGAVVVPIIFMSVVPPVPTCKKCGATQKKDYGPVIDMERKSWDSRLNQQPHNRGLYHCAESYC